MAVEAVDRKGGRVWRVRWRDADGQPRSQVVGRKTDAELFDSEIKRRKRMGTLDELTMGQQTLREFAEEWWVRHVEPNLTMRTREKYSYQYDRHILPHLGSNRLSEITPDVIDEWMAGLRQEGLGETTVRHVLAVLSSILANAERWGKLPRNPVERVKRPSVRRAHTVRPLPRADVERLRAAAPRAVDRFIIGALAYGGFRPQELLALQFEDVGQNVVTVTKAIDSNGSLKHTKTGSNRTVRLRPDLRAVLDEWVATEDRDTGFLLRREGGAPWTDSSWRTWHRDGWQVTLREAGLELRPYDLRHTFVSTLIEEGRSIVAVAAESGHNARTCLDVYAHVFADAA